MVDQPRELPPQPSLEQQQKSAKELLKGHRSQDAAAIARIRRHLPDKQRITLADAQFVLAREYGFRSWSALAARIDELRGESRVPIAENAKTLPRNERSVIIRSYFNGPYSYGHPQWVPGYFSTQILQTLDTFVAAQLRSELAGSGTRARVSHLRTKGGRASGPGPLRNMLEFPGGTLRQIESPNAHGSAPRTGRSPPAAACARPGSRPGAPCWKTLPSATGSAI